MNLKSTIEREKAYLLNRRRGSSSCDVEVYALLLEANMRCELLKTLEGRILFIYVENCAIYFGENWFFKY